MIIFIIQIYILQKAWNIEYRIDKRINKRKKIVNYVND